jgi:hypothetical protein
MKYFIRAVKYLVKIVVLLALLFFLMQWSGTSSLATEGGLAGFFKAFWASSNGKLFSAVLLVWCAIYPAVEFKTRYLNYNLGERKAAIIKALHAGNMTLARENGDNWMVFIGSLPRRLWWLGEDAVTITRNPEGGIDIEGPRRFVMEAQHRIPNYVAAERENEQES